MRLLFPRGAWNTLPLKGPATSIELLIDRCGGQDARVAIHAEPEGARLALTWK